MPKEMDCFNCGRMILSEYDFCPWCGKEQAFKKELVSDMTSDNLSNISRVRQIQIEAVQKKLEELEKELNILVLCRELSR